MITLHRFLCLQHLFQILEVGNDWNKLYPPLRLHQTWVRDIRFNEHDSMAMVTAGDRIAWWKLDLLPTIGGRKVSSTVGGASGGRRRQSVSGAGLFT